LGRVKETEKKKGGQYVLLKLFILKEEEVGTKNESKTLITHIREDLSRNEDNWAGQRKAMKPHSLSLRRKKEKGDGKPENTPNQ